jgi:cytochrome subunit of sulfide dehydrogenase
VTASIKNCLALAALLGIAGTALAAPPPAGRLLASNCFQCHGTNGAGPGFDRLAGESAASIFEEMKEMQSGEEGENLMSKHSRGYTDEQLRALAGWLSQQNPAQRGRKASRTSATPAP